MKKEKEPERAHLHSVPNRPLDTISPEDIRNQVSLFPSRGPIVLDEFAEEEENL